VATAAQPVNRGHRRAGGAVDVVAGANEGDDGECGPVALDAAGVARGWLVAGRVRCQRTAALPSLISLAARVCELFAGDAGDLNAGVPTGFLDTSSRGAARDRPLGVVVDSDRRSRPSR
jgi:hypothetical protein